MKKAMTLLTLCFCLPNLAHADWTNALKCDDGLRIDSSTTSSTQYQVVVTNAAAVARFLDISHLSTFVNSNNELSAPVRLTQTGPNGSSFESDYIQVSANGYVKAVQLVGSASGEFTLNLLGGGPTGPESVEVWKFRGCHR